MPRWRLLLGGPLVWALHFGVIYAATSASEVIPNFTAAIARAAILMVTVLCLIACAWVLRSALRQPHSEALTAFWRTVAATGAVLAIIAIIWQTLPAVAPLDGTAP